MPRHCNSGSELKVPIFADKLSLNVNQHAPVHLNGVAKQLDAVIDSVSVRVASRCVICSLLITRRARHQLCIGQCVTSYLAACFICGRCGSYSAALYEFVRRVKGNFPCLSCCWFENLHNCITSPDLMHLISSMQQVLFLQSTCNAADT